MIVFLLASRANPQTMTIEIKIETLSKNRFITPSHRNNDGSINLAQIDLELRAAQKDNLTDVCQLLGGFGLRLAPDAMLNR